MGKESKSKKSAIQRRSRESAVSKPSEPLNWQTDFIWLLPALVLGFLIYTNALTGAFVYDDQLQISRNTLIQDLSQFWRAMTSDVWRFQTGDQTYSNYWRPSFVFWLILNFQIFGFAVIGWHLTNVLLHLGVIVLAFIVLRQFGVSTPIAGAIGVIFAVHPVHTESVAWISGAPDLILSCALLGSLYFVHLLSKKQTFLRWALALGLYLLGLGAKETALLFPLIIIVALYPNERETKKRSGVWARIISITWPFILLGILYLLARRSILGATQLFAEGGANLQEAILTAPAIFAFYLRQMVFPLWIGPSYPLRAVTLQNIGIGNFVIPLIVSVVALCWMIWRAKHSKIARIGLALFLVPLLPAMNIVAFAPEQLVHDRYLYLPLLGFLIVLVPAFAALLEKIGGARISKPLFAIFIAAMIVSVPLAAQSLIYNRAWTSDLALCERGVRSDPTSALIFQRYGTALYEAKRLDEAVAAFNRSIELAPIASTYVVRATAWIDQQKFAEAERDLREVISKKNVALYTLYRAYRDLGVCLSNQGKTTEAADAIKQGRTRMPQYYAALTGKLSSILWKAGQKETALNELNAARPRARTESLPESRLIIYGLGLLQLELGHSKEARDTFQDFLSVTAGMKTPGVNEARSQAQAHIRVLDSATPPPSP